MIGPAAKRITKSYVVEALKSRYQGQTLNELDDGLSRKNIIAVIAIIVAVAFGVYWSQTSQDANETANAQDGGSLVQVTVPDLTGAAKIGEQIFNAKCAACHGDNGAGRQGAGPPLVHKIYEPSHHGDMAFMLAPRRGVQSHHWPFGDMPPVEGLTDGDIKQIITYVRALQRANGIS